MVDSVDEKKNNEKRHAVLEDKQPESERYALYKAELSSLTRAAYNKSADGKINQWDVYLGGDARNPHKYTNTIAAMATIVQPPVLLGEISFAVNSTDVTTARQLDAKGNVSEVTGTQAIQKLAADAVRLLSDPKNKNMQIIVPGMASYTGHDIIDKNGKSHNQNLSEGRADSSLELLKAEVAKLDPTGHLIDRIKAKTVATGDKEQKEKTNGESHQNRTSSFWLVPDELVNATSVVMHVSDKNIVAVNKLAPEQRNFTLDGNYRTAAGKVFTEDFSKIYDFFPPQVDYRLDTTAMKEPVQLNILAYKASHAGLIVSTDEQITYHMNEDHTVSVYAGRKQLANVKYDLVKGEVTLAGLNIMNRDSAGKDHPAREATAAEMQVHARDTVAANLAKMIDGSGRDGLVDGVITPGEVAAFKTQQDSLERAMKGAKSIQLNTRNVLVVDTGEKRVGIETSGIEFRQSMVKLAGKTSLNEQEMKDLSEQHDKYNLMLKQAEFEMPKTGVQFATFVTQVSNTMETLASPAKVPGAIANNSKDGNHR